MSRVYASLLAGLALVLVALPAVADDEQTLKEDKRHVRDWNAFAENLLKLHRRRIAGREVEVKQSVGGYAGDPDFYRQVEYYDKASGRLISRLQWERENPEALHTAEVYIYDDRGRVIRDYAVAYLPRYRNAPSQTLIFVHQYNDGLHAFRSFDASGELIFERCEGTYHGRPVSLMLDVDEIDEAAYEKRRFNRGIMTTEDYRLCFDGLDETADLYLVPN